MVAHAFTPGTQKHLGIAHLKVPTLPFLFKSLHLFSSCQSYLKGFLSATWNCCEFKHGSPAFKQLLKYPFSLTHLYEHGLPEPPLCKIWHESMVDVVFLRALDIQESSEMLANAPYSSSFRIVQNSLGPEYFNKNIDNLETGTSNRFIMIKRHFLVKIK